MLSHDSEYWRIKCYLSEIEICNLKSDMDMLSDDCDELRDELEACRLDSDRKQEDLQGRIDDLLKSQPNPCIEVALGAEIHSSLEAENSVLKDMVSSHQAVVSNYIRRETEFRAKIKEVSDLRECETNELQYRLDQQAQVIADKDASLLAASDKAIDDCAKIFALTSKVESLERNLSNYKAVVIHMGYGGGVKTFNG